MAAFVQVPTRIRSKDGTLRNGWLTVNVDDISTIGPGVEGAGITLRSGARFKATESYTEFLERLRRLGHAVPYDADDRTADDDGEG